MFDIGAWEVMLVGVMALIILGPERLPGAIKSTISAIRSIKEVANGFKQEVSSQLDAHELHTNLKKAEALGMQNIGKDLQASVDELKAAAASVQAPYKKPLSSHPSTNKEATQKELPNTIGLNIAIDQSENQPTTDSEHKLKIDQAAPSMSSKKQDMIEQKTIQQKPQSTDNE